ncbi:efflux RND transporter periplasmic adaptor subunit [Zoogloea sp.]|uniref:efflux RND transporter periplasmic adaptor subunit n=1 Tax=Zoogloea sp. TaxID=49181 RepID=UPI00262A6A2A|nr:efflux RND transporter periplasmic adaptor subunit [Zoogloea sp.]MDD3352502.1 efflux RND transporter periplasmic adaptor subunit [Zoogloea sp.]
MNKRQHVHRWAALALSLSCLLPGAPAAGGGADIPTLTVQAQVRARTVTAEATIEAVRQATVAAQVQGRVLEARVDAGARVRQGDVLMRIDTREADQALAAAGAQVAAAQARLVDVRAALERAQALKARNFVSGSALDQAQAVHDAALAQVRAAEAGRAQVAASRGFATVTAPFSGIVAQRLTEPGEMAQPGRPLLVVYEPGALRAVADLPQARLAELGQAGLQARIEFPESGRQLEAADVTLLPATDPRTHTARARVSLPADAGGVVPGMAARVHFRVGEAPRLAVPAAAVLRRGEVTGVYVADGKGGFVLRQLRVGSLLADGSIEVLAGLKGGELLALDPVRAGLQRSAP